MVTANAGILIAFIVGNYLDFITIAYVHLIFPTIFLLTFLFFPDTPYHFVKNNNETVKLHYITFKKQNLNSKLNHKNRKQKNR